MIVERGRPCQMERADPECQGQPQASGEREISLAGESIEAVQAGHPEELDRQQSNQKIGKVHTFVEVGAGWVNRPIRQCSQEGRAGGLSELNLPLI